MLVRNLGKRMLGLVAVASLVLAVLQPTGAARADAGFDRWVASFRSTAAQSGISKTTFDRAFRDVTDPDPEVLEKARKQAEFTAPAWARVSCPPPRPFPRKC